MKLELRNKIRKDIGIARKMKEYSTELDDHKGYELRQEALKLDKKILFFKNLEKKLK